jgi:hypothetical protein
MLRGVTVTSLKDSRAVRGALAAGVFFSVLLTPSVALADAGPGVDNPAQNVLNYGSCVAIYGVFGLGPPLEFLQNNTPGVVFQYQPYDTGETRDVRPGTACSVGFLAPPPGND